MKSFDVSQSESSLSNLCASLEEILVHYHRIIEPAVRITIELAFRAADNFSNFVESLLEQPSSPLCLPGLVRPPDHPDLSAFDNLVGVLMFETRRLCGSRIPKNEYGRIAKAIDDAKFKPLNYLEGECRKALAQSNRDARKAIHTFEAALRSHFRRAALKRIYRAYDKWREKHPIPHVFHKGVTGMKGGTCSEHIGSSGHQSFDHTGGPIDQRTGSP